MRTEGVYTYLCEKCETFFAVVSRFSAAEDFHETLICPKCTRPAVFNGEGFINHEPRNVVTSILQSAAAVPEKDLYPYLLDALHVSEILGVSRRRAYEIMELKGFPLKRIGVSKRVIREDFFQWIKDQQ